MITIVSILSFLLQSTILQHLRIFGVIPNISLIIIVCLSLLAGKKTGSIIGLVLGFLQDIIFFEVIGIHALIYFLIGYLIGLTDKKVFKENLFLPFVFTFIATFAFHTLYYVLMYFSSINVNFTKIVSSIVLLEATLNSLLSIIFYKQFLKLYRQPKISFRKK